MQEIDTNTSIEKFSYSKISTYLQCKFKFKLKYFDKNFLFSANIATDFGSLVHETEELIAKNILSAEEINYKDLKNRFIIESKKLAHKYPTEFYAKDKSGRSYLDKTYYYLNNAIYRLEQFLTENPNYTIIGIEQKFEYLYKDNYLFTGSIDRAFLDTATGNIIIQDIKTWPVLASEKDLVAPLQFVIYTLAAQELWKTDIANIKCEYDLPLCEARQRATSEDLVTTGIATIDKALKGIKENKFRPSISALCHWCEYNPLTNPDILNTCPEAVCPYFSTWQKSGDPVRDTLISWQDLSLVEVDRKRCISQLRQQWS